MVIAFDGLFMWNVIWQRIHARHMNQTKTNLLFMDGSAATAMPRAASLSPIRATSSALREARLQACPHSTGPSKRIRASTQEEQLGSTRN